MESDLEWGLHVMLQARVLPGEELLRGLEMWAFSLSENGVVIAGARETGREGKYWASGFIWHAATYECTVETSCEL